MDEIVIRSTFELGKVSINYAEIEAAVISKIAHYKSVIVTEENIPEFKQALADVRKLETSLNADRISIEKIWNEPVIEMKSKLKPIFAIFSESVKNLAGQLEQYELKRSTNAREDLQAIFEANPIKDITFDHILKPAWLLKGSDGKRESLLITEMERINGDLEFIESTEDKAEAVLVRDNYLKTLDVLTAQSQARVTLLQVRKIDELRRQAEESFEQRIIKFEADAKAKLESVQSFERIEPANLFENAMKEPREIPPSIYDGSKIVISQAYEYAISFPDMVEFSEGLEALRNANVKFTVL